MAKNRNKNKAAAASLIKEAAKQTQAPAPVSAPARTRGVLLIALGHPEYGKMAFNLLATIRAADPDTPVALVHNETSITHLSDEQKNLFSQLILCPADYYMHAGKAAYVKPKVYAYDLSPFDDTMFIDCDVAMMPGKRLGLLMDQLAESDFAIKNTGRYDIAAGAHEGNGQYGYGGWETKRLPELAAMYRLSSGYFYQVQGEVFWFRKNVHTAALFKAAKRAWTEQRAFINGGFAGQSMNDELAFIIALAWTNIQPAQFMWKPTYWYLLERGRQWLNRAEVMAEYWMLSAGGNNIPPLISDFYDDIVAKATRAIGFKNPFKYKVKSAYLPERKVF